MGHKYIAPAILFVTTFVIIIIVLIVLRSKKKKTFKKTIEDLDLQKNKLIGIPILSELSKVRELVKTEDLKQKLAYWDETFKEIKEEKMNALTDLITEADFLVDRRD